MQIGLAIACSLPLPVPDHHGSIDDVSTCSPYLAAHLAHCHPELADDFDDAPGWHFHLIFLGQGDCLAMCCLECAPGEGLAVAAVPAPVQRLDSPLLSATSVATSRQAARAPTSSALAWLRHPLVSAADSPQESADVLRC